MARNISFQLLAKSIWRRRAKSPDAPKKISDTSSTLKDSKERIGELKLALEKSRATIKTLNARNDSLKTSLKEIRHSYALARAQQKALPSASKSKPAKDYSEPEKDIAQPKPPKTQESSAHQNLPGFNPEIIVSSALPWCALGVRDPSFLVDEEGALAKHDGSFVMLFSGRDKPLSEGGVTAIGIAKSFDLSEWNVQPEPIFTDGAYATSGSIVKLSDDTIRLYYAFDTARGFRIAETKDLKHWQIQSEPIAEPRQFRCRRIGLPHAFKHKGEWFLLFEGLRKHFNIYGLRSTDGASWHPLHQGEPVYLPSSGAWDELAQANPSVAHIEGKLHLVYNGYSNTGAWDIGIRKFADPSKRIEHSGAKPLIARTDLSAVETTRLEGARILRSVTPERYQVYFFDLPTTDAFSGGRIWQCYLDRKASLDFFEQARATPAGAKSVEAQPPFLDVRFAVEDQIIEDVEEFSKNLEAEEEFNNKFAEVYFDIWDKQPIQRVTKTVEDKWIKELVKSGDNVLLVGSGGGREIECLLEIGARITAMDISPRMLQIGAARYPNEDIEWVHADAQRPPESLRGFDHAMGVGLVLCYLPNPELALANLRDTLKIGGVLTLGVVNREHFTELNPRKYLNSGRVRFAYSVSDMKGMLQRAGFLVMDVKGSRFLSMAYPETGITQMLPSVRKDS